MDSLPFQYQKREYWEFYCPICKTQRRSFYWPSPRKKHYFQLAVLGLFLSVCLWPWMGLKGIIMILPIWAFFEFIYRARARQSLICPHCGFDPYLYKYDAKLARDKVQKFFAEKEQRRKELLAAASDAKADEPSTEQPSKK